MSNCRTKKRFSDLLKEKDHTLHDCLVNIRKKGLEEWVPLLTFDAGSHSGYPHLLNVEQNANEMVPDYLKEEFSAGEIFLLLASIFLHDIGRIGERKKDENTGIPNEPHHEKSHKIISKHWAELGLPDERIGKYCAIICKYHCINDPYEATFDIRRFYNTSLEPYGSLRIPLISAILRFSDEAENCWKRSLQNYLLMQIKEEGTPLFKAVRRYIEDVEFCQQGQCIIFHVPADFFFEGNETNETNTPGKPQSIGKEAATMLSTMNNMADKLKTVLQSNWNEILRIESIIYRDIFFEYHNQLSSCLQEKGNEIQTDKLAQIVTNNSLECGVKDLFEAMLRLFNGSLQHRSFTWNVFEAEIGHKLSERESWCISRMNTVDQKIFFLSITTDNFSIINFDLNKMDEFFDKIGFTNKEGVYEQEEK